MSYHIISYHIISYHIISYHIISCHIMSYHIISYHIISYHITSYHIISYHIISYRIMSYHIISHHITLNHVSSIDLFTRHTNYPSFNLPTLPTSVDYVIVRSWSILHACHRFFLLDETTHITVNCLHVRFSIHCFTGICGWMQWSGRRVMGGHLLEGGSPRWWKLKLLWGMWCSVVYCSVVWCSVV